MNPRELILLSPYRLPAQNTLMVSNEDVAAFLNGYTALWHPAAARGAKAAPRVASPYDHEQPGAGFVYAIPENPPLLLPDDWEARAREVGAVVFRADAERTATFANLQAALAGSETAALFDLPAERVAAFLGIGFGQLIVDGLFEAMEHQNVLAAPELWQDVQDAIAALADADPEAWRRHLKSAADRLLAAREVVYPVTIHLLDLYLLGGERVREPLPASFAKELPVNVVACGEVLEAWAREHPEQLATLRQRVEADQAEVCGGPYIEREDALLPLESQLWNLLRGQETYRALLGQEVRVFGRKRFAFHPQTPQYLQTVGIGRALLLAFDDSVLPNYRAMVINWPAPDGKQVEAFARVPYAADNPQTFFHAAHYLHKTIMQDHGATLALLHNLAPAAPWYEDWLELSRFAPVLGQWTTLSRYFGEVLAGEYASAAQADEYHGDYLTERTNAHNPRPVSGFARQVRRRRRLDAAWTLTALERSLGPTGASAGLAERLRAVESLSETAGDASEPSLSRLEADVAELLAARLLAGATAETPGYLVLNPCSYTRRLALELDTDRAPLPIGGMVKACQVDEATTRLVVEVPALGFTWLPRSGPPGTPPQTVRMNLADQNAVRNEFFEAEIDPTTGGLRGLRDHRTRGNRLGQQLVFQPGSAVKVRGVRVTSTGPALGEVITEGTLIDPQQDVVLATFRQRFRAWLGRPVLELRIELEPVNMPQGYPWHAYYGARFAWRDERAALLRGVNGSGYVTTHTRPQTPDYLEVRQGKHNTVIFPGGLPFHHRHGSRMLDVILLCEGEMARAFDLAIGLDREHPMLTAQGLVTPANVVPVAKGPPHVGATGWLFHLDASNLMLTTLRPTPDGADAVVARLLECTGHGIGATLRCVRDPRRAVLLDARGNTVLETAVNGDTVSFDAIQGDLVHLRVDFAE